MALYKVTTVLEPPDSTEIKMDGPINLNGTKVYLDDTDQNKSKLCIEFEVSSRDENSAKELALSKIMKETLPAIILTSRIPYQFADVKTSLISPPETQWIPIGSMQVQITVIRPTIEIRSEEFHDLFSKINGLEEQAKIDLSRAIKYWNRAMRDSDPIDRFLNLYIAFELLAGSLLEDLLKLKEESEENKKKRREWVKTLNKEFGIKEKYRGRRINVIRAALLHYKNKELSKDEAEEIIRKHVDEFSQEVFKLIKIYLKST